MEINTPNKEMPVNYTRPRRRLVKTRVSTMIIIGIIATSLVGGAVLFSQYYYASLHGDIDVNGIDQRQTTGYLDLYSSSIVDEWGPWYLVGHLSSTSELVMPLNITEISYGENKVQCYHIYNNDSFAYSLHFTINDSWFDNPQSPYYGFTYGVMRGVDNSDNLLLTNITLVPTETLYFTIWYHADNLIITPPSGFVPVSVNLTAQVIE
jgi:hypothetical protein